jgi:hypothetical protein
MASPLVNERPVVIIPNNTKGGPPTKVQKFSLNSKNYPEGLFRAYNKPTVNSLNFVGFPINKNKKSKRKTRRKQKGGFYPSVYGGVCGAKILAPLVARQMMRMYETHSKRKTKRRSKKLSHKKRG